MQRLIDFIELLGFIKSSSDVLYTYYLYNNHTIVMYVNTTDFITIEIIKESKEGDSFIKESLLCGIYHVDDVESDLIPKIIKFFPAEARGIKIDYILS